MQPVYEVQGPGLFERIYQAMEMLFLSETFALMIGLLGLAIACCLVAIFIGAVVDFIRPGAIPFMRRPDPFKELSDMSSDLRIDLATRLLAACLPEELVRLSAPARAIFQLDLGRIPHLELLTADGAPIALPGETLAIVQRIMSPDMPVEAYGALDRQMSKTFERRLVQQGGPGAIDDLDHRFAPTANIDSAIARRREDRAAKRRTGAAATNRAMLTTSNRA